VIIVPVPGGGNDTLARIVARKLSDSVKQPVVIDNARAGPRHMLLFSS